MGVAPDPRSGATPMPRLFPGVELAVSAADSETMNPTTLVGGQDLDELPPLGDEDQPLDRTTSTSGVRNGRVSVPRAVPRIYAWAIPAASTTALLAVGRPWVLAPVALTISTALAVATASAATREACGGFGRPLSVVASIPAGFMLMVLTSLTIGLVGGAMDTPIWSYRGGALLAVLAVVVGTGVLSWRRGGRVTVVGSDGPALAGATLLGALIWWVVTAQAFELWSRGMATGTDFLRHLGMVRAVWIAGLLDPGVTSYPRAFDATVAWLSSALGLDSDTQTLWRAAQPLALTMLVVMLLAVMAIAGRATDLVVGGSWPSIGASIVAGIVFVQTAWFSTFLEFGNVMNMIVGIGLLAMLLTGLAVRPASLTAAAVFGGALAVTANAWQLLVPVAALGCLPWASSFLRHGWRDPRQWAVWAGMAVLTVNGLLGVRSTSVTDSASLPTVSNLFNPEWWWFVALGLSMLGAVVGLRRGARQWGASALGMAGGVVALTAYLLLATGSTWELILYYPAKAMWSGMVVLIPLAVVGAAVVVSSAWRFSRSGERIAQSASRALILGMLGLVAVGTVGRGFAFQPHLVAMANGGTAMPNWSLAVIDAMDEVPIASGSREGALLMGVVPATNVQNLLGGFVGMADYVAMESLSHLGIDGADAAPVKFDLARRDSERLCAHLRAFPDGLRITGPNPAAGPGWLIGTGCPASVVKPESWIVLDIDPTWFAQSPWQDRDSWTYPTVAEVDRARIPRS